MLIFTDDMRVAHRTSDGEQPARDLPSRADRYRETANNVQFELVGEDKPVTYVLLVRRTSAAAPAGRLHRAHKPA
ncbi:hypothetical protein [Sphingomonas sp. GC_Shp_3]|uniref:hypothetical protein n=1 Tax=Sphingomonas sp. GC_Shp_3 TaxID=2937383 RepID=UPI00226A03CA|nr:hypothetical protein [Sphingomonas sp. GC_Shp_3]